MVSIHFSLKDNPVYSNGRKGLTRNPPDCHCPIVYNWAFDNFILADETFEKSLQSFETCVLVYNLCGKLFYSLEANNSIWWKFQSYFSTIFYSLF